MPTPPKSLKRGPKWLKDWLNGLREFVVETQPIGGINTTVQDSPSGRAINAAGGGSAASSIEYSPFDIIVAKDEEGDGLTATLVPGTCNQLLPTNMFDEFSFSGDELFYAKVKALTDGRKITSCVIELDGAAPEIQEPTPFGLPVQVEIVVGMIYKKVPTRTIGNSSVRLLGSQQFIVDKDPPAEPGQLDYTPYFIWALQP